MRRIYNNVIIKNFNSSSANYIRTIQCAIEAVNYLFNIDIDSFLARYNKILYIIKREISTHHISALTKENNMNSVYIYLYNNSFNGNNNFFKNANKNLFDSIVHEFGHVLDILSSFYLSCSLMQETNSYYINTEYFPCGTGDYNGTTKLGHMNHYEDFAESFTVCVCGAEYEDMQGVYVNSFRKKTTKKIIRDFKYGKY